ncbi:MAG: carbon storage regulator [Ruminiclostridium sp.]|nr:carbon storage regulator [Ruminiclostridium sp.]
MLVVTRKTDESLIIADNIEITVLEVSRDKVKIGVSAPKDIKIIRNELIDTQNVNKDSAESKELPKQTLEALLNYNKED